MSEAPAAAPADAPAAITWADITGAAGRLAGHAHRTPVLTSRTVDELTTARVFFKCENFQRMGAFKFRGAFNALSQLAPAERARGVVAFSSGNHAQAVALAGRLLGIPATIVMPADAPPVKLAATRGYGAEVVTYERATGSREALAQTIASERGLTLIPPFDHPHIIAGQGTAAKELLEEIGPLDWLLVCCGGGGLLSGCAVAARHLAPACRVVGVEPEAGNDATLSFKTGRLHVIDNPQTIADGARTRSLGQFTFPLVLANVHDMLTVSDTELIAAMKFLWERMKIVVEPTGALAFAALHARKLRAPGARIGIMVSGGNADLAALAKYL